MNIVKKLIEIANSLDEKGFFVEASKIDSVIKKLAETMGSGTESDPYILDTIKSTIPTGTRDNPLVMDAMKFQVPIKEQYSHDDYNKIRIALGLKPAMMGVKPFDREAQDVISKLQAGYPEKIMSPGFLVNQVIENIKKAKKFKMDKIKQRMPGQDISKI